MKKLFKLFAISFAMLAATFFVACSDDDDDGDNVTYSDVTSCAQLTGDDVSVWRGNVTISESEEDDGRTVSYAINYIVEYVFAKTGEEYMYDRTIKAGTKYTETLSFSADIIASLSLEELEKVEADLIAGGYTKVRTGVFSREEVKETNENHFATLTDDDLSVTITATGEKVYLCQISSDGKKLKLFIPKSEGADITGLTFAGTFDKVS